MNRLRSKSLLVLALSIAATGCGTAGHRSLDNTSGKPVQKSVEDQHVIDEAGAGTSITLAGKQFTVLDTYTAASGRKCKKLASMTRDSFQVGCKYRGAAWYLRKPLFGNDHDRLQPGRLPAAIESVQIEEAETANHNVALNAVAAPALNTSEESVTRTIQDGENLWRFSRRVTGNAVNWKKIAQFNAIENEKTVGPGQQLKVPKSLLASN